MSLIDNALFQAAVISPVIGAILAWIVGGVKNTQENGSSINQHGSNNTANINSNNTTNHHHHHHGGKNEDDFGVFIIALGGGGLLITAAAVYAYVAHLFFLAQAVVVTAVASSVFSVVLEARWCLLGKSEWRRLAVFACLAIGLVLFSIEFSQMMADEAYIPFVEMAKQEGMSFWKSLSKDWITWFALQILGFLLLFGVLAVQASAIHTDGNRGLLIWGIGLLVACIVAYFCVTGKVYSVLVY